jgi:hypothetical protein
MYYMYMYILYVLYVLYVYLGCVLEIKILGNVTE